MIAAGQMLEYSAHNANYYGTPRAQAEEKMLSGSVLLDIEPNGAGQVKKAAPDAVLVFIMPPSMEELERRLRGRGDTPEEQIKSLKIRLRIVTVMLLISLTLMAVLVYPVARELLDDPRFRPGQNYNTIVEIVDAP
jgi:guanylate kinase